MTTQLWLAMMAIEKEKYMGEGESSLSSAASASTAVVAAAPAEGVAPVGQTEAVGAADSGATDATNVEASTIADQADSLVKSASAEAQKATQEDDELQKIREKRKEISDDEAKYLLNALKIFDEKSKEVAEKLQSAPDEEIYGKKPADALKELEGYKAEVILTSLGYSQEDILKISGRRNPDLTIIFRIAAATSISKEGGENMKELNSYLIEDIGKRITKLVNEADKTKFDWADTKHSKVGETLKKVMKYVGFSPEESEKMIQQLMEQKTKDGEPLDIKEDDLVETSLESLVKDKKVQDTLFRKFRKEIEKTAKNMGADIAEGMLQDTEELIRKAVDISNLAKISKSLADIWENDLPVAELIDVMVTGESHAAHFRNMGYHSEEDLRREGKKPLGVFHIEEYLGGGERFVENARKLYCKGFEDILKKEDIHEFEEHPNPQELFAEEKFTSSLEGALDHENHKKFALNIAAELIGKSEEYTHEQQYEMTDEAMAYLASTLVELVKKHNGSETGGSTTKEREEKPEKASE